MRENNRTMTIKKNSTYLFLLTKIILKLPTICVNLIPNKSLTCDVNTWMAAPVVNLQKKTKIISSLNLN